MRGYLASSIGVACAAALALPLTAPQGALAAPGASASAPRVESVPGSTQSLALTALSSDRSSGEARAQGLSRRDVQPFSLVGVVWDDPDVELHGRVKVRTRTTGTNHWSGWQDVETHNHEHSADPGSDERAKGQLRGSTAPLWVGDSDGVEIRVESEPGPADRAETAHPAALPEGLRLELVDPGEDPPPQGPQAEAESPGPRGGPLTAASAASSAVNEQLAPLGSAVIPELSREQTRRDFLEARGETEAVGKGPYIGPRPRIVTRKGWGADEKLRETGFAYTKSVRAAFVHHSASGNNYRCSQAPSVLRSIYRYHVKSSGWRDIGYNFAVDKCGTIYEGRAGGVAKPVMGAHTLGFNSNSTGIAVLGSYNSANPPKAAVKAVARLTAWKLGLYGINPRGTTYLKSGGGNLYKKGSKARLHSISGHRDGFATECPGARLYGKLDSTRDTSARYQGR